MGPALEMEGKLQNKMEIPSTKLNDDSVCKHHEGSVPCAEDNTMRMEAISDGAANVQNRSEDVVVNITSCTKSADALVEAECEDATENSSSFGDTVSGTESCSDSGDVEVDSSVCGGNGLASVIDGALPIRKRKLTDQWRRFIHPIMWRCKWAELQVKELQSQALKYDRELAKYDKTKQFEFGRSTVEGCDAKLQPSVGRKERNQIMKRKKRKQVEETADLASYMSHHNLFSYYEYRRSVADGALEDNVGAKIDNKMVNCNDNFGFEDGLNELREDETFVVQILRKIELAQSEVRKLRARIDKVVSENPGKFTSVNRLNLITPCDPLVNSDRAVSTPKIVNGIPDRSVYITSQHTSEYNMEDLFMPETAVPSHREATPFPDMIESTGLPHVGFSCGNIGETIIMQCQASDEELQNFERVISKFTENPQVSSSTQETLSSEEMSVPGSTLPSSSKSIVRNNKRKGRKHKPGSNKWSRRSSG